MPFLWNLYKLRELMRNQWLTTGQLEELQRRKLTRLLKHAYDNVGYYSWLFDSAGVKPEDINAVRDLRRIPITTKSHIRSLPLSQLIARGVDVDKCEKTRTSGSTGMPLDFYFAKKEASFKPLLDLRVLYSNGYKTTDKILAIARQVRKKHWFQYVGIMRKEYISYFQDMEKEIGNIRRIRPDILWGQTSNIILLAALIEREGTKDIQPRLIFTNAEILDQKGRDLIASVFGVKPLDGYASHEFGSIAWECQERKGYHINIDSLVVEFLKDGELAPPGESGEIVITSLYSYAMPLIRYSIGDVGIFSAEPCPCGRGLPLMSIIEGRVDDFLLSSDGRKVSSYPLRRTIADTPGVSRYQIIQEEKDRIVVKIIKGERFSAETMDKIKEKFRAILGDKIEVQLLVVDDLPKDQSGKFRTVIGLGGHHS